MDTYIGLPKWYEQIHRQCETKYKYMIVVRRSSVVGHETENCAEEFLFNFGSKSTSFYYLLDLFFFEILESYGSTRRFSRWFKRIVGMHQDLAFYWVGFS